MRGRHTAVEQTALGEQEGAGTDTGSAARARGHLPYRRGHRHHPVIDRSGGGADDDQRVEKVDNLQGLRRDLQSARSADQSAFKRSDCESIARSGGTIGIGEGFERAAQIQQYEARVDQETYVTLHARNIQRLIGGP